MNSKKYRMEKITNRILINVGIGFIAYIVLWMLYSKFIMPNVGCLVLAGIFAVSGIITLCLNKLKGYPIKNYSYMFFAFTAAMLFMKLSTIIAMFIGKSKCAALYNIKFFSIILNTTNEVMIVSILGAIYLVIMFVYNIILLNKISKEKIEK